MLPKCPNCLIRSGQGAVAAVAGFMYAAFTAAVIGGWQAMGGWRGGSCKE